MMEASEKKQNVLIVHNYYQIPGGEDTVVANEKKMLEDHGHKVVFYSRNNSELKEMGILKKLLLPFTTVFNPKTYRDIKRLIKQENIEIVHVHNTLNLVSPAVYYATRKMGVPVVQTIHNFRLLCPGATFYRDGHICEDCVEHGLKCAIKHNCYRGSKAQTLLCVISTLFHRMTGIYGKINYICLTEFNKEKLLNLKQVKEDRVFVKPNFVESTGKIVPAEERKNQFVFAGRLDKLKGIDILLDAWKTMGENAPKLIVCGTGLLDDWCRKFVAENRCNVELRGFVPNEETKRIIGKSRALILPTQWYEGFPMTVLEAYSTGTFIIGSSFGNVGSLIDEEISGIKINSKSYKEIVNAVSRTCFNSQDIIKMFSKRYGESSNYEQLIGIYKYVSMDINMNKDVKNE